MNHKVGDDIYVGTSLYISRGSDDFHGGLCKITKINKKQRILEVAERPGCSYNYEYLMGNQEKWKKEFGDQRGYPCPDIDTPWD